MLSCKKCGAQMSGIDLVCKKCGTPWGKKSKSKKPIFVIIFFTIILFVGFVYYKNPTVLADIKVAFELYSASNNKPSQNKPIQKEEQLPKEENKEIPKQPAAPVAIPVFTSISASSNLSPDSNFTYTADKLVDGDSSTAWLEGANGNGVNEWILLKSDTEQSVSGVIIYNGYQKNATTYKNNGRLKKVRVTFSDGSYTDRDIPAQSYSDSLNGVTLDLGKIIKTTSVQITALDVYAGSYYNDTAINEIKIY